MRNGRTWIVWAALAAATLAGCESGAGGPQQVTTVPDCAYTACDATETLDVPSDVPVEAAAEVPPETFDSPTDGAGTGDAKDLADVAEAIDAADVPGTSDSADAEAPDGGPDCGPAECIDCTCTCADGQKFPYGGCFDSCNPVPDVVRNCSADCSAYCGTPPTACQGPGYPTGGAGTCGDGRRCVQMPCPRCGVAPPSFCVPQACAIDGCWIDSDCGSGLRCVAPNVMAGNQGQCLPATAPPQCWTDGDCPDGATCQGATHCPVCTACGMLQKAGTCVAGAGEAAVLLWVDSTFYSPGEKITPVWWNFGVEPIYLPGCTTFTTQRQDAGVWTDLGATAVCFWEGVAIKVVPGGAWVDINPWTAPMDVTPGTAPTTYRFAGDYRTGCQDGKGLSEAGCTGGPTRVLSREFTVQMVQ